MKKPVSLSTSMLLFTKQENRPIRFSNYKRSCPQGNHFFIAENRGIASPENGKDN
jgi:hypothetical protein